MFVCHWWIAVNIVPLLTSLSHWRQGAGLLRFIQQSAFDELQPGSEHVCFLTLPLLPEMVKFCSDQCILIYHNSVQPQWENVFLHFHTLPSQKVGHNHIREAFYLKTNNVGLQHKPISLKCSVSCALRNNLIFLALSVERRWCLLCREQNDPATR